MYIIMSVEEMSKSMQFSFNDLKLRGFAGVVLISFDTVSYIPFH
jgi:hypothetical protein